MVQGENGNSHFTLFIQARRVKDSAEYRLKAGLRDIALAHKGDFRLTPNQT